VTSGGSVHPGHPLRPRRLRLDLIRLPEGPPRTPPGPLRCPDAVDATRSAHILIAMRSAKGNSAPSGETRKRSPIGWMLLALSLSGLPAAACLYTASRSISDPQDWEAPLLFVFLAASGIAALFEFLASAPLRFRVALAVRPLTLLFAAPLLVASMEAQAILLGAFVLTTAAREPYPRNILYCSAFVAFVMGIRFWSLLGEGLPLPGARKSRKGIQLTGICQASGTFQLFFGVCLHPPPRSPWSPPPSTLRAARIPSPSSSTTISTLSPNPTIPSTPKTTAGSVWNASPALRRDSKPAATTQKGVRLEVLSHGKRHVVVRSPDGLSMKLPRSWTDIDGVGFGGDSSGDAIFTVESLRELGVLLEALAQRESGRRSDPSEVPESPAR